MTTLRFLFILFLLFNALAYAAISGWFGIGSSPSEAERLTGQINSEHIKLLGPPPQPPTRVPDSAIAPPVVTVVPPPPPPPPTVRQTPERPARCVMWSNLSAADINRLQNMLRSAGIEYNVSERETTSSWWVRIPPLPNREAAEQQVRELRERGVIDIFIVRDPGPNQWAISLGNFKTESAARRYVGQLQMQGVSTADAAPRIMVDRRIEATAPPARIQAAITSSSFSRSYFACTP
jgi:cell division septation protein DedD